MKNKPGSIFPRALSGRAVPLGFNMPSNRICINLYAYSDVSIVDISLYEYHGLYWYSFSLRGSGCWNSCSFLSLRNAVSALRGCVRDIHFTLDNSDCLARFVRAWDRQEGKVA